MLQSGHEVTPRRAALGGAQALAEGILIHFVALLRHAKNDTFIIIHFLLDTSHRNGDVVITACYYYLGLV